MSAPPDSAAGPAARTGAAPAGPPGSDTTGAAAAAGAGEARLTARADHTQVTVGDPITVTFTLRHPEALTLATFDADRGLGGLDLLTSTTTAPRRLPDGSVEEARVVTFAAYKPGPGEIPAVKVLLRDASGAETEAVSAPISFSVVSVLKEGESEPADLKKPIEMRERLLWPWFLVGALALAVAAWFLWRRLRRRRPAAVPEPLLPAAPPRPEHEIAYEELQRLLAAGLLERGEVKKFYIALAEIIRRYLGRRFDFDASECTSWEILEAMRGARLPGTTLTLLAELLGLCDLVKFAKHAPGREETQGSVERAYRLVDETRRAAPPPLPAEAAAPPGAAPSRGVA